MEKNIIFVCNGNIHRSVIAAESLRKILKENGVYKNIYIDSYGLQGTQGTNLPKHKKLSEYTGEWGAAKPTLERLGINIDAHSSQKILETAAKRADVIIAMDTIVYSKANNSLLNQFPNYTNKIHRFSELTIDNKDIKDPSGSEDEQLHKIIIGDIYHALSNKYMDILKWVE